MTDTTRRAVRTLLQVLAAAIPGLGVLVLADVLTASQATKAGAVLTVLSSVVSAGWNAWENRTGTSLLVSKHPST